ncbi:hypothetical protein M2135_001172 [Parabacteroides sp. PF5-9]|nr:hypothetical protein [Parabacteroides sp. PF5-9]
MALFFTIMIGFFALMLKTTESKRLKVKFVSEINEN